MHKITKLILNKPLITNFARERNNLLEKVKNGEWVLFLDSDESIYNLQLTRSTSLSISNEFDNYQLRRKNYFLKQYVGTDKIVRLVKKGTGKWVRTVHEVWKPNKIHPRGGILNSSVIIHNTADNLSDYISKINNYSTLHARENKKEGKNANLFKIIFYPIAKFIVTLIKSKNIVFSIMQSLHSFLAWAKLYLHQF